MKVVKILGTGCAKCKTLTANAIEAAKQAGIEIELIKIEDIEDLKQFDRTQWLSALAGSEWRASEMPECWQRIKPLL